MNFASDNVVGAAPEVLAAVVQAAENGVTPSYGSDPWTSRIEAQLKDLFETDLLAFPVATGTAANSLSLACLCPPWGCVYGHEASHAWTDECGAPEFFTGGARLVGLAGEHGRLSPEDLERALSGAGKGVVHRMQPAALTLTQATEAGTVYRPAEIAALTDIARRYGLGVHMDGARFANAVASLGISPANLTWRVGVDVLSLGATKNGALAAEVVVFFSKEAAQTFAWRRKRGGHLVSKMRFLSAQIEAWLTDGLWLRLAKTANHMAARLAYGLEQLPSLRVIHPVEANEVFVEMPPTLINYLIDNGAVFYRWEGNIVRLVCSFATDTAVIDKFIQLVAAGLKPRQVSN